MAGRSTSMSPSATSQAPLHASHGRRLPVDQQFARFAALNRDDQPCGLSTLPTLLNHFVKRADRASVGRVVEHKTPHAPVQRNGIDEQANFAIGDYCRSEPVWP